MSMSMNMLSPDSNLSWKLVPEYILQLKSIIFLDDLESIRRIRRGQYNRQDAGQYLIAAGKNIRSKSLSIIE